MDPGGRRPRRRGPVALRQEQHGACPPSTRSSARRAAKARLGRRSTPLALPSAASSPSSPRRGRCLAASTPPLRIPSPRRGLTPPRPPRLPLHRSVPSAAATPPRQPRPCRELLCRRPSDGAACAAAPRAPAASAPRRRPPCADQPVPSAAASEKRNDADDDRVEEKDPSSRGASGIYSMERR
uniref:Uncharacterized protein n=1 Tax=Arundo donax TaxID=35708 RepID=A0A0A8Y683_ARUDO